MTTRLYRAVFVMLVLYWVTMFILSHLPPGAPPPIHVSDKLQHLGAYTLLTILLDIALGRKLRSRGDWVTILIVLIYGAIDELLQPLTGRQADLMDWFADAAGASIGVCICGIGRGLFALLMPRSTLENKP